MAGVANSIASFIKEIALVGLESIGRYYSSYQGFVADNNDPNGLHRLRLCIPDVSGSEVYDYWALPKGLYHGDGYGVQFIPKNGDVVWVEFRKGHPNKPIWTYGYRGLDEVPQDEPDVEDISCHWLITPGKIVIKLNDTKKYIHIKTPAGDYVEINSKSISLVTDKKISLGTLDQSKYHAVLGEKLVELLTDMQSFIIGYNTALASDLLASSTSQFLKKDAMTLEEPKLKTLANGLAEKLKQILSEKNTLD